MAGINGFGAQLLRGDDGTPQQFHPIGQTTSISGPGLSRETIDVTAHDSPDGWMEHIGGLRDAGEVSVDLNYDPALHDVLVADFDDESPRRYQLVFPDPDQTSWEFDAILTTFEPEAPHDDKLAASLTLKVTGRPVLSSLES